MAHGPGKYDDLLTAALKAAHERAGDTAPVGDMIRADAKVQGGCLIVLGSPGHNGFACQLSHEHLRRVPALLRNLADQIEADLLDLRTQTPAEGS